MAHGAAELKESTAVNDAPVEPDTRGWWRYLLVVLLLPVLFYPFPFLIATSPNYEHWATSQWGPMLEYAYDPQGQDADVVIFGDSTAFIGIDPRLLNAQTGLRSLVLPDTIGSIPVTGDEPLQLYMQRNRAPRLLVLYFSPWNLDFDRIASVRLFEGEEMMLRHGSLGEIGRFTLHHPTEMLVFPFRLYSTFGPKMVSAALHHVNRERDTAEALGHADYNGVFPALKEPCSLPAELVQNTGVASVDALVRKYTTQQTKVVVYLAPVPDCEGSATVAGRSYAGVHAAAPQILPAPHFAGDPYYAHILPPYVPEATGMLARALEPEVKAVRNGAEASGR